MNPYDQQPRSAFWRKAVSGEFSAKGVMAAGEKLLTQGDRVVSAGSCFAANIVPWIEKWGFEYIRTEMPHPKFAGLKENLGYRNFSAAYGNLYTPRQLLQLYKRALGMFHPAEDRWYTGSKVIDPFRPGLRHAAESDPEFDLLTKQHLESTRRAFETATVFIFTLGLTECWESKLDGAVYPACPGTISGEFDSDRHVFRNLTVVDIESDLVEFIQLLRQVNSNSRFILTVSPVPLVATATAAHVLNATVYSKSVLRVAAQYVVNTVPGVAYFPAYEIVTGPQAEKDFFGADRRTVTDAAIAVVMEALYACCEPPLSPANANEGQTRLEESRTVDVSARVVEAECDEELLNRHGRESV